MARALRGAGMGLPSGRWSWLAGALVLGLWMPTAFAQSQQAPRRSARSAARAPAQGAAARVKGRRLSLGSQFAPGAPHETATRLTLLSTLGPSGTAPADPAAPSSAMAAHTGVGSGHAPAPPEHAVAELLGLSPTGSAHAPGSAHASAAAPQPGPRPPSGRIPTIVPALQGPPPRVSTSSRGTVLVLCDVSGSMRLPIAGAPDVSKAQAAAEATNNTLMELILSHRGGDGGVRNRLDVMLLQYGASIRSALAGTLVPLADLANAPVGFETVVDANGVSSQVPIWVRPQIDTRAMPQHPGGTPMTTVFAQARQHLRGTLGAGEGADRARRLMLAFNITDGQPTDGNPEPQIAALAQEAQAGGHDLIMTNIHISENPNAVPVLFPTEEQAAAFDAYGQQLFRWSSPVPPELMALVRELNPEADQGTGPRMMAVNANLEGLNSVIQVGSSLAAAPPAVGAR